MKKRIAIISDIHGNARALKSALKEIDKRNYDEIICMGDIFSHGSEPKESLELLKSRDIKILLGNDECKLLGYLNFAKKEKEMFKSIKKSLLKSDKSLLKKCDYKYEIPVGNKKILLSYYFIEDDEAVYPFSRKPLWENEKKFSDKKYLLKFIGHVHKYEPLEGNTIIVPSVGVTDTEYAPYTSLEIDDDKVTTKIVKVPQEK